MNNLKIFILDTSKEVIGFSLLKRLFLAIAFISILAGCKKFIEVNPPINRLVTETVFKDQFTATAAQTNIYSQMEKYSYSISLQTGILSDELKNWSTQSGLIEMYTNSLKAMNAPTTWKDAYNFIYQSNAVLQGLTDNIYLSDKIKNQLTGEAKFIRSFWYFYLVNLYGDVPLLLGTDYKINAAAARAIQADVYNQIKSDLTDARTLLNANYVDETDTLTTSERVRPTKSAASALLARVYLFCGDFSNAKNEASRVISNASVYALESNLNNVFLKNSKESIWQIQIPLPRTYNTTDGKNFILTGTPSSSVANNATISSQLQNSFETGDNRKLSWIKSVTVGANTYNYPYKYKIRTGSTITEYTMVLRLAEQYLIRAEASAQLNDIPTAIADLNVIRRRAGLLDYSGAADKISVLSAILHERQVELFAEWGHRWLDLKRTSTIDLVMSAVTPLKGGAWEPTDKLLPIPQSEIGANPSLTQNVGY